MHRANCGRTRTSDTCVTLCTRGKEQVCFGRTGYSPRACIYGLHEGVVTRGLDNYPDTPNYADIARRDNGHMWRVQYRAIAMPAIIDVGHA